MASAIGMIGGNGSSSWIQVMESRKKKPMNRVRVCSCASSVMDLYKTLRIQPGASKYEVKKAFRQLALQYHPYVAEEAIAGFNFKQSMKLMMYVYTPFSHHETDSIVMSKLRGESNESPLLEAYDDKGIDEAMKGIQDTDWDLWEEWMGWEGAGIRDYSSHINPYILTTKNNGGTNK